MFDWPNLELTPFEKESVARYSSETGKPGVMKRVYKVGVFSPTAQPQIHQTAPKFMDTIQVARRSRVFALVFTGNVGSWYLNIQDAAGELYTAQNVQQIEVTAPGQTEKAPRGCLVSSMFPGPVTDADSWRGPILPGAGQAWPQEQEGPLDIDPNWILYPNTTLQFEATICNAWQIVIDNPTEYPDDDQTAGQLARNLTLSIAVHVWEFPGMTGAPRGKK